MKVKNGEMVASENLSSFSRALAKDLLPLLTKHHDAGLMERPADSWGTKCAACQDNHGYDLIIKLNEIADPGYKRLCRICFWEILPGEELQNVHEHKWHIPIPAVKNKKNLKKPYFSGRPVR